jgi:outer membrane biosynthesis protein TonB
MRSRSHSADSRDSALRRLANSNRWLLAGSVALTGVLSEVAAQAFPGKTLKSKVSATGPSSTTRLYHSSGQVSTLKPPAQAPTAPTEQHTEPTPQAAPEQHTEPTPQAAPEQQPAPAEQPAPTPEPTPTPAPETSAPPVVSGGS